MDNEVKHFDDRESDHVVSGVAIDGETIIRLRSIIEEQINEEYGPFDHTKLFWNLKDVLKPEGEWVYQLHFYKEAEKDGPGFTTENS